MGTRLISAQTRAFIPARKGQISSPHLCTEHSSLRAGYRRPGDRPADLRRPGADVLLRGGFLHRDEYQQRRDQMKYEDAEGVVGGGGYASS